MKNHRSNRFLELMQEYSVFLILGVVAALFWANLDGHSYHEFLHYPLLGDLKILGYPVNFHFLINDFFMVLFFGIAAVEIMQAVGPGGSLNPLSQAVNPLLGTIGGVVGPVAAFFVLCYVFPISELFTEDITRATVLNGWGIPTATDIALAWLVARLVFGPKHPAVSYLLLLAVVDDAIGLGIIAVFYPDPSSPVEVHYLGLTLLGMLMSHLLYKKRVGGLAPYLLIGGGLSWLGLIMAHLHPALALVFIVPFMPRDNEVRDGYSTLINFEHRYKTFVDVGLFGFGLANAGVLFSNMNDVTWIILGSLILGKTIGITLFGYLGHMIGFKLPKGMDIKTLMTVGVVSGLGLTVALFVSGEAYTDLSLQGAAKMGALFSVVAAPLAFLLGKVFMIKKIK